MLIDAFLMLPLKEFEIVTFTSGIGWPRGRCAVRGDLGCLAKHAKAAGYRVDDLAARLGVSPRNLRREFKDSFGKVLKNWLVELRELEVRRRLLGNESIQEIAYSVGFSHAKELAREFIKVYGVKPSIYRARERQRADRQPN